MVTLSDVTNRIRRGRRHSSVVYVDRLWRYHDPGRYPRGHGEAKEDEHPSSSDEDVAEADKGVDEPEGSTTGASTEANDNPETEHWAEDAQPGAIFSSLPSPSGLQRPLREWRRPGWLWDYCDILDACFL